MTFLINPYRFGELWTPAQITTSLWLDAADASTITTVSGAVSQWNDKSVNGRNAAQGSSGARPGYTAANLNGRNVITFDGVDDFLATSGASFHSGTYSCFAVAIRSNTTGVAVLTSQDRSTSNSTRNGQYLRTNSATIESIAFNTSGSVSTAQFSALSPISWRIYSAVRPSANVTNYVDAQAGTTATISGTPSASSNPMTIGARESDVGVRTNFWNGRIGEYVFLGLAVDTSTRQLIEGYLAWKWGLTANLPSNHPYKSAAPTI